MKRFAILAVLMLPSCGNVETGDVLVKGGTFIPGNDTIYPEEKTGAAITVFDFYMDRYEVTNREFTAFVKATGYVTQAEKGFADRTDIPVEQRLPGGAVFLMPAPGQRPGWTFMPGASWRHPDGPSTSIAGREDDPVVQVTFADALAYARWKGRDLPTEAEWEWAAGQGRPAPGRDHPMNDGKPTGNNWDGAFPVQNDAKDGYLGRAPVGQFPANALGLHDMTGNVWEITSSIWTASHAKGAATNKAAHVIKGGSYLCAQNFCARYRPQSRQMQEADMGTNHVGFRTVKRKP
ncbi:SUMF1/EgtB/PvdO family nonheme iron enzyme [Sphingorhabdus sp.]|jgi:sulfatase modifying factor 1|uniref:SUMF1/EgtB/PvdO family nonheme iron enzyme n=3 Tax=Sphingorhabdus sp. TaxID=1902408 RepID=UPI003BAEFE80